MYIVIHVQQMDAERVVHMDTGDSPVEPQSSSNQPGIGLPEWR